MAVPKLPTVITLARNDHGAWTLWLDGVAHPEHYCSVQQSTGTPYQGVKSPTHDYVKVKASFMLARPDADDTRKRSQAVTIEGHKDLLRSMGLDIEEVVRGAGGEPLGIVARGKRARVENLDDEDGDEDEGDNNGGNGGLH